MKIKYTPIVTITLLLCHFGLAGAETIPDDYTTGEKYFRQKDYKNAIYYFNKSAKNGSHLGQGMLCALYNEGKLVEKNYRTAAYWCEKSARQGDPMAQYDLGNMYVKGEGVPNDFEKAIYWYYNSARSGHPPAYFNLGVLCYKGQGVAQNLIESYKWFSLAEKNGLKEAGKWTHILEEKMSKNQIAEANQLSNAWKIRPK